MTKEREGEILLVFHSFFESWFPIVASISITMIGAIHSYAWTVLFAAISFTSVLLFKNRGRELLNKANYHNLILSTLFITLMYILIFTGLKYTTAGNAAVIIFMQLFFAYLYFNLLGQEQLYYKQTIGALCMAIGAIIMLLPENMRVNQGDLIILAASAIGPIANLYQKRARAQVSSATLLSFRSLVAFPIIWLLATLTEPVPNINVFLQVLPFLLINGFLLMGLSKLLWIEAIHRISITKASAMIALIPLFTLFFAYYTLNETPSLNDGFGAVCIMIGSYFISRLPKFQTTRLDKV